MRVRFWTKIGIVLKKNIKSLLIFIAVVALVISISPSLGLDFGWSWDYCEPLIGFATLLVAFGIWFGEKWQAYVESLEKRLTVIFLYPTDIPGRKDHPNWRRIAVLCEQVYLSSEGDLRAWSQQVAGTAAYDRGLNFMPFIREDSGQLLKDRKTRFQHYRTVFELRALPEPNSKPAEQEDCDAVRDAIVSPVPEEKRTICWYRTREGELDIRRDQTRWFDAVDNSIVPMES